MARYRIHYLKESQRQHFRQAPPSAAPVKIKMRDYQPGGEIDAASPYAAWKQMREEDGDRRPIDIGDVLENDGGVVQVCRYVGFEDAEWVMPEPPPAAVTATPTSPAPVQ